MSKDRDLKKSTFGTRLKQLRNSAGLTQPQLAEKSGVSLSSIGKYETDVIRPKTETSAKLAEALNVSLSELIGFGEYMAYEINHQTDSLAKEVIHPSQFGEEFFKALKELLSKLDIRFNSGMPLEEVERNIKAVKNLTRCFQIRSKIIDIEDVIVVNGLEPDFHERMRELSVQNIDNANEFNLIEASNTKYEADPNFYIYNHDLGVGKEGIDSLMSDYFRLFEEMDDVAEWMNTFKGFRHYLESVDASQDESGSPKEEQ